MRHSLPPPTPILPSHSYFFPLPLALSLSSHFVFFTLLDFVHVHCAFLFKSPFYSTWNWMASVLVSVSVSHCFVLPRLTSTLHCPLLTPFTHLMTKYCTSFKSQLINHRYQNQNQVALNALGKNFNIIIISQNLIRNVKFRIFPPTTPFLPCAMVDFKSYTLLKYELTSIWSSIDKQANATQ